ncbi:hypothetical protein ACRBEV_24985 [Methylobacterium phyllosphaerae]
MAVLLAPLLGGCLSAQDGPLDQIALDQIPRAEPAVSRGGPVDTADLRAWRLRLDLPLGEGNAPKAERLQEGSERVFQTIAEGRGNALFDHRLTIAQASRTAPCVSIASRVADANALMDASFSTSRSGSNPSAFSASPVKATWQVAKAARRAAAH